MIKVWTLMTAMPPTKGHLHLMEFVSSMAWPGSGEVIVCTQPGEPFAYERYEAIAEAAPRNVTVRHLFVELPQDPNSEGFWDMWRKIMFNNGWHHGDIFVSSEPYGATLAEVCGGKFMPYDIDRELLPVKATNIRNKMVDNFHLIMPTFQHNLRTKVTVFGAESTGKTTLAKELAGLMNGHFLYEYARPYLTHISEEISIDSMRAIWKGQLASELHADFWYDKPYLFQDTDLFSTLGYWLQPHWFDTLDIPPLQLETDAMTRRSDLYLITTDNIPFEEDKIRYGGDHRESPDQYWIDLAENYHLNYRVLKGHTLAERTGEAMRYIKEVSAEKADSIKFERKFNS